MLHDIKNFYEVTDIDIDNRLEVIVELVDHNNPDCTFTVNGLPVSNRMTFSLLDSIQFKCSIASGAVQIIKITINNLEILPLYQHLATPATAWITSNWELDIPSPFYAWYHDITGQGWIA